MAGAWLGFASLLLVVLCFAWWFRLLREVAVAGRRGQVLAAVGTGVASGMLALSWHPGWFGGAAALLAMLAGSVFLGLAALSRQDRRQPAVHLLDPMPAFECTDDSGRPWSSAGLAGRPYLLKFFRGHW